MCTVNKSVHTKKVWKLIVCCAPLTQVLESQCQQSVNLDPAISESEDYSAISAQVSEVQRD